MACQVVHYPHHSQLEAEPAPEPRDVVWNKIAITPRERLVRSMVVMGAMTFLLLFWAGAYPLYPCSLHITCTCHRLQLDGARDVTLRSCNNQYTECHSARLRPRLAVELRRN
jgi:hypothetical protein